MQHSSFIKFVRKVKGKKIKPLTLKRMFRAEVDPEDYAKEELSEILDWVVGLSGYKA